MTDSTLDRRRFVAAVVAVPLALAGCTTDDSGDDADEDEDDREVAIDLSESGFENPGNESDARE